MKRLAMALVATGISVGALSAVPAATDPTIVNVPQLPGGLVLGGSVNYLDVTTNNDALDYASINVGTSSSAIAFSVNRDMQIDYDWGWGANVGYIFPGTGNDINLSYFQLDVNDQDAIAGGTNVFISPIGNIDPQADFGFPLFVAARINYDINQADLTAGQFIDVGCRLIVHPFGGLRWANVDRELASTFVGTATSAGFVPSFSANNEKTDFNGIGPLLGIDGSYYVGMGVGVVSHFDTALLVGDLDVKTNKFLQVSTAPPAIQGTFKFKTDSDDRIVPVVDEKLGLDYTFLFDNVENSDLTVELGWQFDQYFNAVDRLKTNVTNLTEAPNWRILRRQTSDIGLNGPYLSVVLHA